MFALQIARNRGRPSVGSRRAWRNAGVLFELHVANSATAVSRSSQLCCVELIVLSLPLFPPKSLPSSGLVLLAPGVEGRVANPVLAAQFRLPNALPCSSNRSKRK